MYSGTMDRRKKEKTFLYVALLCCPVKFCFTLLLKLYELLELQQMFDLLPVALMMMIGVFLAIQSSCCDYVAR